MKKLLVLSLLFFVSWSVPAQNYNHVRRMEFEVGMGVSKAHKIDGAAAKAGMQLYLETRMNVVDTPFDVGLQIMLGAFDRKQSAIGELCLLGRIIICEGGNTSHRLSELD